MSCWERGQEDGSRGPFVGLQRSFVARHVRVHESRMDCIDHQVVARVVVELSLLDFRQRRQEDLHVHGINPV